MSKGAMKSMAFLWITAIVVSLATMQSASAQNAPGVDSNANAVSPPLTTPSPVPVKSLSSDTGGIEEVVVTAQRRSESLSRVGETVTAISSQMLENRGVEAPADLEQLVPGFQATQSFNGNPIYTLRGVGFTSHNAAATSPVGLYMDEAALPYPYMSQGLIFDLARVEVLYGPQGTLYGRNATGGLINYIAAKPTDDFQAGGTLEGGNFGTANVSAFVSGPLVDSLKARFAVNSQNRFDGWQQSVTRNDSLGVLHQNSMRFILDYDNSGPLTASLTATYWNKQGDPQAPQATYYIPDHTTGLGVFGNNLARASIISNPTSDRQADWAPNGYQPQSAQSILRPSLQVDSDFTSMTFKAAYKFSSSLTLMSLTTADYLQHRDVTDSAGLQIESETSDIEGNIGSISQELRLVGDVASLNWSAGAYYAKDRTTEVDTSYNFDTAKILQLRAVAASLPQTEYSQAQISSAFGNFQNRGDTDTSVLAGFANADYEVNSVLKFSGGLRFTQDKTSTSSCSYDYKGGNAVLINLVYPLLLGKPVQLQPGGCFTLNADETNFLQSAFQGNQTKNNVAWRGGIDYTPNSDTLVYGTVSRSYEAGSFPLLAANTVTELQAVKPEELTSYEIGSKLAFFDRVIRVNTALFYYDYANKQLFGNVPDIVFGTVDRILNVPQANAYGIQGDIAWRVTPELTVNAAGLFEKSRIGTFFGYDEFGNYSNFKGHALPYAPPVTANVSLDYLQPLNETLQFDAGVAANYQRATNASISDLPEFAIASRTVVDGTLGVASLPGRLHIQLFAKNLFNKYYWTGVDTVPDAVDRFAGMPRQYGIRISKRF